MSSVIKTIILKKLEKSIINDTIKKQFKQYLRKLIDANKSISSWFCGIFCWRQIR